MSQFLLKINLGNDAMQTGSDIAGSIRVVADQLENGFSARAIWDINGNQVGQYKITGKSDIMEVD
jgi:hypothetical protein